MALTSRETGESSTAITTDEYRSFCGFEFGTYAHNEIKRRMESNSTDTNKLAHHIFAACNPISIILVNLYNQLETTKEKYKESERSARADNIEYGHIPDIRSQIKRTSAFTRITDTIKAEGVRHSVKRRNQTIKLWKMNHSNLHNRYSRNQKQEWFNWVVSVPENTSYSRSSMGRHEHVSRPRKPSGRLKEVLAR